MSKWIRRGVVAAALAVVMGLASTSMAGVVGTVSLSTNPAHDLNEGLTTLAVNFGSTSGDNFISVPIAQVVAGTPFSFKFTGLNFIGAGGSFVLAGSYDGTANSTSVSTTSYTASGGESIGGAQVAYNGTISVMDLSLWGGVGGANTLKFLMTPNSGPASVVLVNTKSMAADISPVPLPSAAGSGMLVLAVLGVGAYARRRHAM